MVEKKKSERVEETIKKRRNRMLERFVKSPVPSILRTMLSGKTPECFLPPRLAKKLKNDIALTDTENKRLRSLNLESFRWSMDLMAKMLPSDEVVKRVEKKYKKEMKEDRDPNGKGGDKE